MTLAGLTGDGPVECSRGVRIVPDVALSEVDFEVHAAGGRSCGAARDAERGGPCPGPPPPRAGMLGEQL